MKHLINFKSNMDNRGFTLEQIISKVANKNIFSDKKIKNLTLRFFGRFFV